MENKLPDLYKGEITYTWLIPADTIGSDNSIAVTLYNNGITITFTEAEFVNVVNELNQAVKELENKKINKWNLHGYVIELLADGSYSWTAFTHWDDGDDPFMGITVSKGKCTFDSGKDCILVMNRNFEDSLYDGEDPDKILAALPVWDKTKYWAKENDFGSNNGLQLRDTKTGEQINH